ncbi:MAG: hypothetical protein HGB18_01730 [Candidatus Moranbacteria bacterium]|nr:hypothetical protein [Candidatus Moranbacteria bacterium]
MIVTPAELDWVGKYISDAKVRIDIEKLIYKNLLQADSYWDPLRKSTKFTITEDQKRELAKEVLRDEEVGLVRKIELAREYDEPNEAYIRVYLRKLLYDRHYDQAAALGANHPDVVIEVVRMNIENLYLSDAENVIRRFLPERKDLLREVRGIKKAFA